MNTPARPSALSPTDWRDLNLAAGGRSLIEASAGTGKTWTIAVLYLRLLLERGLSPRQIVVTTFTEAAAQELRERLRDKLQWAALHADSHGEMEPGNGEDSRWLEARWRQDIADRRHDLQRLRLALAAMDVAPIGTLHSLCRRILTDYPFACGVTLVMGEMIAGDTLLDEVTGDLWRRLQQASADDEWVVLQQAAGIDLTLKTLQQQLQLCLAPGVTVRVKSAAEIGQGPSSEWLAKLRDLVTHDEFFRKGSVLRRSWDELAKLIDDPSRVFTGPVIKALKEAQELKGILQVGKENADILDAAELSVQWADYIEDQLEQAQLRFWYTLTAGARQAIQTRLQTRQQLTFDALLDRVSQILLRESAGGTTRPLADALFAAWPVALVDEFQDTDGLQYGILDTIYRDAQSHKRGRLVMIGDPKQAIYRFRGGDIHAYQRAAAEADSDGRLTLGVNYRSSAALVEAFNQFYRVGGITLSTDPDQQIRYQAVTASGRCQDEPYTVAGQPCSQPLQIHYQSSCPAAAGERRAAALEVCANQIADLLQSGRHRIGGTAVQPSDLAVLLPTGKNISELRNQLQARGVPCVTSINSSVFDTDTARELQVVLYAVAHSADPGALRAAAITRLWGARFSRLQQWGADPARWQSVTQVFRDWHRVWGERGVQAVVEALLEQLAPRYLATLGGERVLTDLRHLGELLQEQAVTLTGKEALLAWFSTCREGGAQSGDSAAEAAQLRIESDSRRVRLMTLHASKGLEFPIVFLPLLWDHSERRGSKLYVVSDPRTRQRTVEISPLAKQCELQDLQDERLRVLYVALTRAIHACHVYALPPQRCKDGRTDKAATGTTRSALDVMLERMVAPVLSAELSKQTPNIRWIDGWQPVERHRFIAADAEHSRRQARCLPAKLPGPLEARHSFTTLTQPGRRGAMEAEASAADEDDAGNAASLIADPQAVADHPAAPVPAQPDSGEAHPPLQALAAVRGTDFGNAVHAVFEHRAIGVPMAEQYPLIEFWLNTAGVHHQDLEQTALIELLAARIQGALEAPLDGSGQAGLCLAALPAADQRTEMAFYFILDRVSMKALRQACAQHGEPDLVPRSTQTLSGLMNGKIDLLFQYNGRYHLLDYKGNYLGDSLADYQGDALLATMDQSDYRFQALLYTVAVDRYLRQRLGETYERRRQLGECFYLFIRAAGLAPAVGIWRQRFSDALLDAVAAVLTGRNTA